MIKLFRNVVATIPLLVILEYRRLVQNTNTILLNITILVGYHDTKLMWLICGVWEVMDQFADLGLRHLSLPTDHPVLNETMCETSEIPILRTPYDP